MASINARGGRNWLEYERGRPHSNGFDVLRERPIFGDFSSAEGDRIHSANEPRAAPGDDVRRPRPGDDARYRVDERTCPVAKDDALVARAMLAHPALDRHRVVDDFGIDQIRQRKVQREALRDELSR